MFHLPRRFLLFFAVLCTAACAGCHSAARRSPVAAHPSAAPDSPYQIRPTSDPDGTGRYYLGRGIAPVMGHEGMGWLERPEREREERTDLLLSNLGIRPTDVVVDLGAGSGFFSFRIAPLVPQGAVLAVDIQPEMLAEVEIRARRERIPNVRTVRATETSPGLPPDTADLVLLVDAYHEFSYPREVMAGVVRALRRGGRVALVEYRAEDPTVPIKRRHKMTKAQARREMEAVCLRWMETKDVLPQQHLLFFEKR